MLSILDAARSLRDTIDFAAANYVRRVLLEFFSDSMPDMRQPSGPGWPLTDNLRRNFWDGFARRPKIIPPSCHTRSVKMRRVLSATAICAHQQSLESPAHHTPRALCTGPAKMTARFASALVLLTLFAASHVAASGAGRSLQQFDFYHHAPAPAPQPQVIMVMPAPAPPPPAPMPMPIYVPVPVPVPAPFPVPVPIMGE